jgi:hypothetical protein
MIFRKLSHCLRSFRWVLERLRSALARVAPEQCPTPRDRNERTGGLAGVSLHGRASVEPLHHLADLAP